MITIRNESKDDFRAVEEVTRKAFWNVHTPGCNEHYLVHAMREHDDFIPELAHVLLNDGVIIGNIMYAKSRVRDEDENEKSVLSFGPLSILPEYQRKGYGTMLVAHSLARAKELGYDVVVIFGNPGTYVGMGFKSCKKYNVCFGDDIFPTAMLVKELRSRSLENKKWRYEESDIYNIDDERARMFDMGFPEMRKEKTKTQEEFYILSNSRIY